jgi:hypothetical protein
MEGGLVISSYFGWGMSGRGVSSAVRIDNNSPTPWSVQKLIVYF